MLLLVLTLVAMASKVSGMIPDPAVKAFVDGPPKKLPTPIEKERPAVSVWARQSAEQKPFAAIRYMHTFLWEQEKSALLAWKEHQLEPAVDHVLLTNELAMSALGTRTLLTTAALSLSHPKKTRQTPSLPGPVRYKTQDIKNFLGTLTQEVNAGEIGVVIKCIQALLDEYPIADAVSSNEFEQKLAEKFNSAKKDFPQRNARIIKDCNE